MTQTTTYTDSFFELIQESSQHSAREIVPLVLELIQTKSVIDVGCGVGIWLSVFQEFGVQEILGIDGEYVDRKKLHIPTEKFLSFDLTKTFRIDQQFDLVVSLEVAEHLPSTSAETFVESLTKLGKVILFSAAIPFQGGADHLNEQWLNYWSNYFQKVGYVPIDCLRRKIWQNNQVDFWYAQNILIFAEHNYLETNYLLKREFENIGASQLAIVHPKKYLEVVELYSAETKTVQLYKAAADPKNWSLKQVLSVLPIIVVNGFKRTAKNIFEWVKLKV